MHPLDGLAGQTTFFSRNIGHNLDFIPDDKLDWKPAPSALSALAGVSLANAGKRTRSDSTA